MFSEKKVIKSKSTYLDLFGCSGLRMVVGRRRAYVTWPTYARLLT